MSETETAKGRFTHCKACDKEFNTFNRTVEGPIGPLVIEEDLCTKCRKTILTYGLDLDSDEDVDVKSLLGQRHEAPPE